MAKDRPNKIPTQKTIARHYSEGKYCDYPADIVLGAVNAFDYDYNPTTFPIEIGFQQMFAADFNAFVYLCEHKDEIDIEAFLSDANGFMANAGIDLAVPFNDIMPKVLVTLLEDDMFEAIHSADDMAICSIIHNRDKDSWRYRHPERYDRSFMLRECFISLDLARHLEAKTVQTFGFSKDLGVDILFIAHFFAEDK